MISFFRLRIFVNPDLPELKENYIAHAIRHNAKIMTNAYCADSGFDLLQPRFQQMSEIREDDVSYTDDPEENNILKDRKQIMKIFHSINFEIQCSATNDANLLLPLESCASNQIISFSPFYLYPRSSCSFTPMRLANSVGIIDAGYRGNIQAMIDFQPHPNSSIRNEIFYLNPYDRYFQICSPTLSPILVEIVDSFEQLGTTTQRSTGGFGSTNIN